MPGGVGPVNYPPCLYDTALDTVTALPATYTGANFQCNNGHIYPNILANVHNQSWCGLTWSPIKYTYSGTACPLNSTKTSSDSVTAVTNPGSQVANGGSAVISTGGTNPGSQVANGGSAVISTGGTNVDCVVGPFTDTTTCDPAGSGFLMQQANITIQPSGQGAACGPTSQVGTTRCPVDCVVSWADGACDPNTGMLTQTGTVTTQAAGTGRACPTSLTKPGTNPCHFNNPTGWSDQGFWSDQNNNRQIPNKIGTKFNDTQACIDAALQSNPDYNVIGFQYMGECWAGFNTDYTTVGRDNTGCNNIFGCTNVNHVITKDGSYNGSLSADYTGWTRQSGFWNLDGLVNTPLGYHRSMADLEEYTTRNHPDINIVFMQGVGNQCYGGTNANYKQNGPKTCGDSNFGCNKAGIIATSGSFKMPGSAPTGWTDQGFWTDNGNYRILYDSIGNFPTLEAGVAAALAKNPKYNIIGMQNGKEVMAGVNNDYTRYGRSDNCTDPFGCPWVSRIITKDDSYKNDPMVDLPGWRTQSGFWNIDYMFPTNLGTHNTMAECQAYAQNSFPNINVVSLGQNDTLNGKHPYCWGATNVDYTKNGQKSCGNPASGCLRATRIATFDKNAGSGTSANNSPSNWTDDYRNGQIVALNTKCPSLSVATIQGYDNAKIYSTLTGSCP